MNQSRPSIKPYHQTYDPQAVPFKKRGRFSCADDTTSEEIGPSDDRRVRSRFDIANTGVSNKTKIAQIEKKSSNTANDEVAHGASMSPVAIRPSEGRLPLAISASEEEPGKERDGAKKPAINGPSEPQGTSVFDGGIKQVDSLKEVTEHKGVGGESGKSEPRGDGGNNDGVVIDKKIIKQTKDVIQQEGGGNENDSNSARDDVKKLHQPEPVKNLDGSNTHSRADTTIEGKNINSETEGAVETTKGKEPVHDVVSAMVMGGYDLVKSALDSVGYGSGGINEAGNAFETTKGTEVVDVVSTMVLEGGPDWDTMVIEGWPDWDATAPYLVDYGSGVINNNTGGEYETSKGKETVDDVVSTIAKRELEPNKGKEPIVYEWTGKLDASDYIYESGDINETTGVGGWLDWEENNAPEYKSRGINVIPMIHQRHTISKRPFDYTRPIDASGDPASSNSQEPLANGRGESSMRRPKCGLRLFGFDI